MIAFEITDWILIYALLGLVTLFVMIQHAKNDPLDWQDISENLGQLVTYSLLAWPYVLIVWVFSWPVWMKKL